MKELEIQDSIKPYKIYFNNKLEGIHNLLKDRISQYSNVFLITDNKVSELYREDLDVFVELYNCKVLSFQHGEKSKNLETIKNMYNFLIDNSADRESLLIGFGGGVVGDMVGYVAANYMRGIPYINIPTTFISQIDSCIGGKVGFNYNEIKNLIGTFYNPEFVFVYPSFLNTLSHEQYIDGLGEVIKYALIDGEGLMEFLENNYLTILNKDVEKITYLIHKSLHIKSRIIEKDFKDTGIRNVLNIGHTIGHGIEVTSNYSVSHGTAVALGILGTIKLSEYKFGLSKDIFFRMREIYNKLKLPTEYKVDNLKAFMYAINHDKKNSKGEIKEVLLKDLGKYVVKVQVSNDDMIKSINEGFAGGV